MLLLLYIIQKVAIIQSDMKNIFRLLAEGGNTRAVQVDTLFKKDLADAREDAGVIGSADGDDGLLVRIVLAKADFGGGVKVL